MSQPNHDNAPRQNSEHCEEFGTVNQNTVHIEVEAFEDVNFRPLPADTMKEIQLNNRLRSS